MPAPSPARRPTAPHLLPAALLLALAMLGGLAQADDPPAAQRVSKVIAREQAYFEIRLQYLVSYLAAAYPGGKYLVITRPKTALYAQRYEATLAALKPLHVVKMHDVLPAANAMNGEETILTAPQLDQIIAANPTCTVVLCLVSSPPDLGPMKLWRMKPEARPTLILVDSVVCNMKKSIKNGTIGAVVIANPDADIPGGQEIAASLPDAFHQRYLMITAANVDEIDTEYPEIFVLDREPQP